MQKIPERTTPISVRVNPDEWESFKLACRKEGLSSATNGINLLIAAVVRKLISLSELEQVLSNETEIEEVPETSPLTKLQEEFAIERQAWSDSFEQLSQKIKILEELTQTPKKDLAEEIAQVNQRLTLCKIKQKGNRLYLRASVPSKDGTSKRSQILKTGTIATLEGLHIAEGKAKKLESDLMLERFKWSDWLSL